MKHVKDEILIAILVNLKGFDLSEAKNSLLGSDIDQEIDKILNKHFKKIVEFTDHISKLEKGCAPSVSLMDTRIDIAKKAIEQYKTIKP